MKRSTRNSTLALLLLAISADVCWGQDAATFRQQAEAAFRAGQYGRAESACMEAIRRDPNDAESFDGLSKVYM
jgi:Flp pilus assembly protein TadD